VLNLELAGITLYTSTTEGAPVGQEEYDETEDARYEVIFSICLPPPIFELQVHTEEFQFGLKLEKKKGDGGDNKKKDGEDPTSDGAVPDEEVANTDSGSEVKEGFAGSFECGWVKIFPVGPIPLAIRIGGTGKIGFEIRVNEPGDSDTHLKARFKYEFKPLAYADLFVFLGLELDLEVLKARAGIAARLVLVEYVFSVAAESTLKRWVEDDGTVLEDFLDAKAEFTVGDLFRALKGEVFLTLEIEIGVDLGLFSLEMSFKWEYTLFRWKGIEKTRILYQDTETGTIARNL